MSCRNSQVGRFASLVMTILLTLALNACTDAYAQIFPGQTNEEPQEEEPAPQSLQDSLGRSNPRGTVNGFMDAVTERDYVRAALYVNFNRQYSAATQRRLVHTLQRLLDERGNILPYSWISADSLGRQGDGLPPGVDRIGTLEVNGETITLTVEEVTEANSAPVWLISSETMAKIAMIRQSNSVSVIDQILPEWSKNEEWAGVSVGQWIAMLLLAIIAYAIARGITGVVAFFLPNVWPEAARERTAGIIKAFAQPVRICVALLLFLIAAQELGISIILRQRLGNWTAVIGVIAVMLLFWRLADFITGLTERRFKLRRQHAALSAILFIRRLAKIVIIAVGVMVILAAFGVDVTTGLAALGIGGLALALGAQKAIENFVGSVMLITDHPIRVGDFCKAGEIIGTVLSIGMRSTRIRTLDQTVVTIPNGKLSSDIIENFAHRTKFKFQAILGLRAETDSNKIQDILSKLRTLLREHGKIDPNPARIRLIELAASSINLEVFAYINTADLEEFMKIREELLLRMMDIVKASGSDLAFPSQTLYLTADPGMPSEATNEARENGAEHRERPG